MLIVDHDNPQKMFRETEVSDNSFHPGATGIVTNLFMKSIGTEQPKKFYSDLHFISLYRHKCFSSPCSGLSPGFLIDMQSVLVADLPRVVDQQSGL